MSASGKHGQGLLLLAICAVVLCVLGCAAIVGRAGLLGWMLTPTGLAMLAFVVRQRISIRWVAHVNDAYRAWTAGQVQATRDLLHQVPSSALRGYLGISVGLLEASMALDEGRFEEAIAASGRALAPRKPSFVLSNKMMAVAQIPLLRATRALAAAALGNGAMVRAERALLTSSKFASPGALANVALAEAVVVAHSDNRVALAHAIQHVAPLAEHLAKRERVVFRALRRLASASPGDVYRRHAEVLDKEASALRDWLERLVPRAKGLGLDDLVSGESGSIQVSTTPLSPEPEAVERLAHAVSHQKKKSRSRQTQVVLILWVMLVGLFFGVFRSFEPGSQRTRVDEHRVSRPAASSPIPPVVFGAGFGILACAAFFVVVAYRARHIFGPPGRVETLLAEGKRDEALALLDRLATTNLPTYRAAALVARATERERGGEFDAALVDCETALSILQDHGSDPNVDLLWAPGAMGERSVVLAMLGKTRNEPARLAESVAALHELDTRWPTYAYIEIFRYRANLILALATRDYARASAVAAARSPNLPLSYRDDLLSDLVTIATKGGTSKEELTALFAEIDGNVMAANWLNAVAPEVVQVARTGRSLATES